MRDYAGRVFLGLTTALAISRLALAFVVERNMIYSRVGSFRTRSNRQSCPQHVVVMTPTSQLVVPPLSAHHFYRDNNKDDDDEYHHHRDAMARNKKRTDVRLFLTQRAIQSFIHLLLETRDPHTVRWIENNFETPNLNSFHGTAAFNYTKWGQWDSVLRDMLSKPKDVIVVCAKRRGRPNNPYFEDRVMEFEIDINPVSLVSRIVSVRDQIANEWLSDLDTLVAANDGVLSSYHSNLATSRKEEEECATTPLSSLDDNKDTGEGDCSTNNMQSSEQLTAAYSYSRGVFDRSAQMMLSNSMAFEMASSPIRKGSFDLLFLLATQESVHRVLRQYREAGEERSVSFEWLREFYVSRVSNFFDGSQPLGRADDFLEQLLLVPPSMKTVDRQLELVDPQRIAEDIIRTRSNVCADWKAMIETVPLDHMELRKHILARQMMGDHHEGPSIFSGFQSSSEITTTGEFE